MGDTKTIKQMGHSSSLYIDVIIFLVMLCYFSGYVRL